MGKGEEIKNGMGQGRKNGNGQGIYSRIGKGKVICILKNGKGWAA